MFNETQEQHEMVLEVTHPSGVEEWYCPTCGRRFLMQWKPTYNKVVLEVGDEYAIHSGGKGGLTMQPVLVKHQEEIFIEEDDPALQPFVEWLDSVDFDSWWQK